MSNHPDDYNQGPPPLAVVPDGQLQTLLPLIPTHSDDIVTGHHDFTVRLLQVVHQASTDMVVFIHTHQRPIWTAILCCRPTRRKMTTILQRVLLSF
jgi:hypothetical protein